MSRTRRHESVMGTVVSIDLRGDGAHDAALRAAFAWFHEVDRRFSPYRIDSETRRYGRHEIQDADRSPDLAHIVRRSDAIAAASGGAFSAWRNGTFDPSAYVKGWSADRAADILRRHGCDTWMVNAGGDVLTSGRPSADDGWRIGVQHPFDRDAFAAVLTAADIAVATSGLYERGAHILDPRSGVPVTAVASVTVCGPELALADAYSTAAFVLGDDGPAFVAQVPGYESFTIFADARVIATAGFPTPVQVQGVPVSVSAAAWGAGVRA